MSSADGATPARDLEAPEVLDAEVAEPDKRVITTAEFRGPLPPPNVPREYEHVKPGLADVIVNQWQSETTHRHKTVDALTTTDRDAMLEYYGMHRRGQWLGFVVLLLIVGLSALALLEGQDEAAIGGFLLAGGYAITAALRGQQGPPPPPPVDLADGNEIERAPESS